MRFPRWPHIDEATVRTIADAVEREGGDMDDVEDLCDVWERVASGNGERADRMRYETAHRRCNCADGATGDGRCERCCGLIGGKPVQR